MRSGCSNLAFTKRLIQLVDRIMTRVNDEKRRKKHSRTRGEVRDCETNQGGNGLRVGEGGPKCANETGVEKNAFACKKAKRKGYRTAIGIGIREGKPIRPGGAVGCGVYARPGSVLPVCIGQKVSRMKGR